LLLSKSRIGFEYHLEGAVIIAKGGFPLILDCELQIHKGRFVRLAVIGFLSWPQLSEAL